MKSNLQTVIYDLTADRIWVANRKDRIRAADRPYVEFSLADAWSKSLQYASARDTVSERVSSDRIAAGN